MYYVLVSARSSALLLVCHLGSLGSALHRALVQRAHGDAADTAEEAEQLRPGRRRGGTIGPRTRGSQQLIRRRAASRPHAAWKEVKTAGTHPRLRPAVLLNLLSLRVHDDFGLGCHLSFEGYTRRCGAAAGVRWCILRGSWTCPAPGSLAGRVLHLPGCSDFDVPRRCEIRRIFVGPSQHRALPKRTGGWPTSSAG